MDDQKPNIYKQLRKLISRRAGDISNQIIATAANMENTIRGRIGEAEDAIDGDAQRRQELLKEFIVGEAAGIQRKIDQMATRQTESIVEAISAMELTVADNLKDTMAKVEELTSSVSHLDYEEDIDSMQGDIQDMREDVADLIDEVHVSKQMEIAIKGLIESVDKVKDLERSVAELKTIAQRNEDNMQSILGMMHSMAKAVKQLEENKSEKE